LRGVEQVHDISVSKAKITGTHHLRNESKTLPATEELRCAEMLLFEATCILEQHTTAEPARGQCLSVSMSKVSSRWTCHCVQHRH
jgi:hypothetical protein